MTLIKKYRNSVERQEKIALGESQSLRLLHDDFRLPITGDDKQTGTLTFTDEPMIPLPEPEPPIVFIPLNPSMSIAARVAHIEEFLTGVVK